MAQCKQTAQEFIQEALAPSVAVLCSHDAQLLCQKNNLTMVEMMQPFCRLTSEAHVRDPGNVPHTLHNLHVSLRDMSAAPPNAAMARKMMSDAVANATVGMDAASSVLSVGDYDLQISSRTPWYEAYRSCFLAVSSPSDHEFLKHFVACIFVVSSGHADPLDQFNKLTQQQHSSQHHQSNNLSSNKWFCPNVFRYYVLLHDVIDGHQAKAEAMYQSMKTTYGVNACHLLQINSRSPTATTATPPGGVAVRGGTDLQPDNIPNPWAHFVPKSFTTSLQDGDMDEQKVDCETYPSDKTNTGEAVYDRQPDGAVVRDANPEMTTDFNNRIDSAAELTEDLDGQSPQSSIVIDHPLASPETEVPSTSMGQPPPSTLVDNHVPTDLQNNSLPHHVQPSSRPTSAPQHGACLTLSDHDRLRIFVHEFTVRGLLPWAERTLRTLSDQLTSRKGIHRSFLSATKKWFGSNKPGTAPPMAAEKANVVYTNEAPEMQMRRLADLAFMLQLYEIAYQTYHTAKRDFNNDHAWLYYAGALEMACLAVFMQGNASQRQYPQHYMESAITTYLNTCKAPQFATRATLFSSEALKSKGMHDQAAMQFIKMTSELADRSAAWRPAYSQTLDVMDSDLRSALLLEQAAHCFINMKQPMVRKYSFHMILAGHRFSKAGQRRHALRSYSQALQVYKGKNWTLAEDHINFTIGRQSFNLKHLENATAAFKHLLSVQSKQSPPQQAAFLKEYLFVYRQQLLQAAQDGIVLSPDSLPQLPLPVVDGNNTRVLLQSAVTSSGECGFNCDDAEMSDWRRLEELLVMGQSGSLPHHFRPSYHCFSNNTQNGASPTSVLREPIRLSVELVNPLRVPLVLTDVMLLWKFLPISYDENTNVETPSMISNVPVSSKSRLANELVNTQVIPEVILGAQHQKPIELSLTPHQTGELHIVGLAFNLGTSSPSQQVQVMEGDTTTPAMVGSTNKPSYVSTISVWGQLSLEVTGPRLNSTKEEKTSRMYGPDRRLDLVVAPPMPQLQVRMEGLSSSMLCGQVQLVTLRLKNSGSLPLHKLRVATSQPQFFTFSQTRTADSDVNCVYPTKREPCETDIHEQVVTEVSPCPVMDVPVPGGVVAPGRAVSLTMWVRGPDAPGQHRIRFLFQYQNTEPNPKIKYRLLQYTAHVTAYSMLSLRAECTRGDTCSDTDTNNIVVNLLLNNIAQVPRASVPEVNVLQISCASCKWRLQHLSTPRHTDVRVSCKESSLLSFKAYRCRHKCQNSSAPEMVFTNVTFDQHQINSASSPCADFYFRSRGGADVQPDADAAARPGPGAGDSAPGAAVFPLLDAALNVELTLIVLWKATVSDEAGGSNVVMGQHHVSLEQLNSIVHAPPLNRIQPEQPPVKIIRNPETEVSPEPREEVASQLLKYSLQFPRTVHCDFSKSRLQMVDVKMILHNCCDTEVQIHVEKIQPTSSSSPAALREARGAGAVLESSGIVAAPSRWLRWVGRGEVRGLSLSGTGTQANTLTVPLRACVTRPGMFDLSASLRVMAAPLGDSSSVFLFTQQKPTAACLLTVTDTRLL